MKRTAILRRTPLRKKRPTPRTHKLVVRLKGADLEWLRYHCWKRDEGKCQDCGIMVYWQARFDGDPEAYDMAHVRNKRNYGDTLENVKTLCHCCHMREHTEGMDGKHSD